MGAGLKQSELFKIGICVKAVLSIESILFFIAVTACQYSSLSYEFFLLLEVSDVFFMDAHRSPTFIKLIKKEWP